MARNESGLTHQMERFAQELARGTLSQAECYRIAYPKSRQWKNQESVHSCASTLAADHRVAQRIAELQQASAEIVVLDTAKLLREIDRVVFSTPKGIFDKDGKILLPHELDDATAAAIKKFKMDELGRIEYEFHDKKGFVDMAMRHRGLYKADNEQKPPEQVNVIQLVALLPLQPAAPTAMVIDQGED